MSRDFTVDLVRGGVGTKETGTRHPRPDLATAYLAPQTPSQKAVAELWGEALKLDRIGVADSFFELGGNSLIGVDIVARLRRGFGLAHLAPHVLYEAPTVEALAALIDRRASGSDSGRGDDKSRPDSRLRAELRRAGRAGSAAQRRRSSK